MASLAAELGVPADKMPAFMEVYEAQGDRGARRWEDFLKKVRSSAEVRQRIAERPELLSGFAGQDAKMMNHAMERLIFCGRYSAKVGTPLDTALDTAVKGLTASLETAAKLGSEKMKMVLGYGTWGDEHAACRQEAFPYRPSVSAGPGTSVIEARAAENTAAARSGQLLGYVAMQSSYVDTIEVFSAFSGQGVASALLSGAATVEVSRGGRELSLDVRAANTPAIAMYKSLGFRFSSLQHPGFLDWDGGYEALADASVVKSKLPPNADISKMLS